MARADAQRLMPSILDRLIDQGSEGTAAGRGYGVREMMDAVRRDLEELLNTRANSGDIPLAFAESRDSILSFGLPDLPSFQAFTADQRAAIGTVLEEVVARHEPRLRDVRVQLTEGDGKKTRLKFLIQARLAVDPAPEVGFETVLELTTGRASIVAREES